MISSHSGSTSSRTSIKLLVTIPFFLICFTLFLAFFGKKDINDISEGSSLDSSLLTKRLPENLTLTTRLPENLTLTTSCERVLSETDIVFNFLNYLEFHYCLDFFKDKGILSLFLLFFWMIGLFSLLWSTAEQYFVQALQFISEDLFQLSPDISGVTFLALGNGSADIFSAFSALNSGAFDIGLGALMGGATFVTTVVLAVVILVFQYWNKSSITVTTRIPLTRDLLCILILYLCIFSFALDNQIFFYETLSLLLCYIIYIVIVIVTGKKDKKRKVENLKNLLHENRIEISLEPTNGLPGSTIKVIGDHFFSDSDLQIDFGGTKCKTKFISPNLMTFVVPKPFPTGKVDVCLIFQGSFDDHGKSTFTVEQEEEIEIINNDPPLLGRGSPSWKEKLSKRTEWQGKKLHEKILYILFSPLILLRYLTIPSIADKSIHWNKYLFSLYPTTSSLFFLLTLGNRVFLADLGNGFEDWMLVLILGFVLSCIVFFTADLQLNIPRFNVQTMSDIYYLAFTPLAFIMSICWIYLIANELVSLLRTLGYIIGLSDAIIGLVILGIGNSLGDLVSNSYVARISPEMSIAACFGTPILNCVMSVGGPITWRLLFDDVQKLPFMLDIIVFTSFCFFFASILIIIAWSFVRKFNYNFILAFILIGIYLTLFVVSVILESTH